MDVLVNYMEKMTIHVSSLTIEYYVLKKNGYNHNFFIAISMLASTNPFLQLYKYIILHIVKTNLKVWPL